MPGDFTAIDSEMLEDLIIIFGPVNKGKLIRRGLHINPDNAFLLKEQRGYIKARGKKMGEMEQLEKEEEEEEKEYRENIIGYAKSVCKEAKKKKKKKNDHYTDGVDDDWMMTLDD
jgi:hypothetical protein